MKILLIHFDRITFHDATPSDRPPGTPHAHFGDSAYSNVLVALTCVESRDTSSVVPEAAEVISRRWRDCRAAIVSLQPFAHLSGALASADQALHVLHEVEAALKAMAVPIQLGSFGFHKVADFSAITKAYPGSVAYREIPTAAATSKEVVPRSSHNHGGGQP